MTNFVTIVGISTSSISNHTKHIDLPSSTKNRLFNKGNVKKELANCVDGMNWSS